MGLIQNIAAKIFKKQPNNNSAFAGPNLNPPANPQNQIPEYNQPGYDPNNPAITALNNMKPTVPNPNLPVEINSKPAANPNNAYSTTVNPNDINKYYLPGSNNPVSEADYMAYRDFAKAQANANSNTGGTLQNLTPEQKIQKATQDLAIQNAQNSIGIYAGPSSEQVQQENSQSTLSAMIKKTLPITALESSGVIAGAAGAAAGIAAPISIPVAIAAAAGIILGVRAEARQQTRIDYTSFATSIKNLNGIIASTNAGIIPPAEAVIEYNRELAKIDSIERQMKELSSGDLNEWLSHAGRQLSLVQNFNDGGNGVYSPRDLLNNKFSEALVNPNPSKVADVFTVQDPSLIADQNSFT